MAAPGRLMPIRTMQQRNEVSRLTDRQAWTSRETATIFRVGLKSIGKPAHRRRVSYWYAEAWSPVPRQIRNPGHGAGGQDLSRGGSCAPLCDILSTARFTPSRGIGTPRGHASSPAGQRGVFLRMHQEDTMTAHRPAKPSPAKTVARRQDPEPPESKAPENGWPAVVWYAIDSTPRTVRFCVIMLVAGVVLLLAVMLGLRFWL